MDALLGFTMNQAMPARVTALAVVAPVSNAPQTLPLAYDTCCIRVSFESIGMICSVPPPVWAPDVTSSLQQPVPAIVTVVLSLRQSPTGAPGVVVASATVPVPGCC